MRTLVVALLALVALGWGGLAAAGDECARFEACCIRLNGNVPQCSTAGFTEAQCAESNRFYAAQCAAPAMPTMPATTGRTGPECTRFATCCTSLYGASPQCDPSAYTEAQCAQANAANASRCAAVVAPTLGPCEEFRRCCTVLYGEGAPQCDVSGYTERQCVQANAANADECSAALTLAGPTAPGAAAAPPPMAVAAGPQCMHFQACCRSLYGDVAQCNPASYTEDQCAAANAANAGQCGAAPAGPGPECQRFQQCCTSLYGAVPQCDVSVYTEAQCAQANAANAGACQ